MKKLTICLLAAVCAGGARALTITADHADAVYAAGETAEFTVRAGADEAGEYEWQLNNFGDKVFDRGVAKLAAGGSFTVRGAQTEPGFLRLDVRPKGKRSDVTMWGVVFDAAKIGPGAPCPADFADFWKNAIARYGREVTEPIKVTEVDRDAHTVMYELKIPSTEGRYVWAYCSEPVDANTRKYPVTVMVPGAGPASWGCTRSRGSINLFVNVHYYDPVVLKGEKHKSEKCNAVQKEEDDAYAKRYPMKDVRYCRAGIAASREEYFYYGIILAANRAVDWVAARPGADSRHIHYTGGSQGGGFGLILTALNKNIRSARIGVPAITDHLGDAVSGREAGWPRLVDGQLPENREAARRNAPYFCGVNFARMIDVPIGFVVGFIDTVCPPHAGYAAFNVCPSKDKAIFHAIGYGHATEGSQGAKSLAEWVNARR